MDLKESPELADFRRKVREWVLDNMPASNAGSYDYRGIEHDPEVVYPWYDRLAGKGWLAYNWPKEYGGPGFSDAQKLVFLDELQRCGAPLPVTVGNSLVGPLIYQFGTDAQKQRFLPEIAANRELWCQGYSEPNAGSDLASLQTRAVREGDEFVINGQKIWTSMANVAHWIFMLVRTDPQAKPQLGISFILVDMRTPGITIHPINQIDGRASFYETFFDNVRVPADNVVGRVNDGWTMAKALLEHERLSTGTKLDIAGVLAQLRAIGSQYGQGDEPLMASPRVRRRLAALEMELDCLRYTRYRMTTAVLQGKQPGPEASIFKLVQSELNQALYELAMEMLGPDAASWYDKRLMPEAYDIPMATHIHRAASIYSGSNEVQRNIVAKRVLGLPD